MRSLWFAPTRNIIALLVVTELIAAPAAIAAAQQEDAAAAAAAEQLKAAEKALVAAQDAYRKALLAKAAALRKQAEALEAAARSAIPSAGGAPVGDGARIAATPVAPRPAAAGVSEGSGSGVRGGLRPVSASAEERVEEVPQSGGPSAGVAAAAGAAQPPPSSPAGTPASSATATAKKEKIVASPSSVTLENGERFTVDFKAGKEVLGHDKVEDGALDPEVCASRAEIKWTEDGSRMTVSAKKLPNGVRRLDCTLKISGIAGSPTAQNTTPLSFPISVVEEKSGEWESRAVFGFHQAGASSSDAAQNYFFDFFIMRGLGKAAKVYDAPVNIWGNVRIASSPQQVDSSVSNFVANFATKAGELKVNELAQSGEFLTGLGVKIKSWRQGGERVRMLEGVGFWGANGAFKDPGTRAQVYKIPGKDTPHWAVFERNFGKELAAVANLKTQPEYVGFVPPDRERFYRQYGAGLRLSTFEVMRPYAPPAAYMITFGRDQLITEGMYKGVVARADVFYPLPIGKKDGKFQFLFLFGTANLRITKPANLDVLALERMVGADGVTPSVPLYDPKVLVISRPSSRDTYRIGVGVDFVNLLNSWRGSGVK